MKILEPIDSVPGSLRLYTDYTPVYAAARLLVDGAVLPVECDSLAQAKSLCSQIRHRRPNFPFRASQRGLIVYISQRAGGGPAAPAL